MQLQKSDCIEMKIGVINSSLKGNKNQQSSGQIHDGLIMVGDEIELTCVVTSPILGQENSIAVAEEARNFSRFAVMIENSQID
ncbi:hypothetical protein FXO38_26255 [Capsicum annuum]|nr:hypothetical protein FXO38_26255 [Capsicum annuum]KAF3641930.1 hypothetical protein FXO37_22743 [Capsicum annuum]